ncbi:unnamed protein product [Paramecium sonneborni]|uniref:Uncharacterized protein n=1 Tax=Paramecium sonneborni TaxID=65129 RepID=A0A8S1L925_9CILI|nr:unnamed protein product [Paramecium sonneborni]
MHQNNSMEFENEDNLLSGLSKQTPSKDGTDMQQITSFQVSPSFQQSQQKQQEVNYFKAELTTNHYYADQQQKNNELSFSLNNQSIKQDNCYFQQIFDNLAKLEMDLNNQSLHESYSEIKSSLLDFQGKYIQQLNFNISDQVPEYQNQYLLQGSESKHQRTRSEATYLIRPSIPKTRKSEQQNINEKAIDPIIFQKQCEEYSLLLDIIKNDIENFLNTDIKDYDQSMELINHYYHLKFNLQNQILEKDKIIQNLQDNQAQINFTNCEYQEHFDNLEKNIKFIITDIKKQSNEELISLVSLKMQELNDQNLQLEKKLNDSQLEYQEYSKLTKQQLNEYENTLQSFQHLDKQILLLTQEKKSQEETIQSLNHQITLLNKNSENDQVIVLRQNFEQLMKQIRDFTILSTKLLQHIYNQTGANFNLQDSSNFNELQQTLQAYFQNWDEGNFKKMSKTLIDYQSEIEVQKKYICIQYSALVQQIKLQRQKLMESLQI